MKKIIIGLILLFVPVLALSAPSLGAKLQGKILLAVEDKGKTYYVHNDGSRYQITVATAQKIFEKLALGVTNKDLAQIPLKDVGISPEAAGAKITECPVVENAVCDYSGYINLINQYKADVSTYGDTIKQATNKINELNSQIATCDSLLAQNEAALDKSINQTLQYSALVDKWKNLYYSCSGTY